MSDQSSDPREPDGVEEASNANAGEPSRTGSAATRDILRSGAPHTLDEEQLEERNRRIDEERKPMGPPLGDDFAAREALRGPADDGGDVPPTDPLEEPSAT